MHTGPARSVGTPLTALALVVAVFALVLGGAGAAFAHAGLSGSDPADGAVLKAAPQYVTLTFTESVSFSEDSLRVLSPQNERVNPRPARHVDGKDNTARVELSGKLPQGTYTVAWRVVSADGHPISGAFVFSNGKPSETAAVVATGSPDDTAVGRLYGVFRHVAYSGLALLVGAAAFVLVCWPEAATVRPVRRLLVLGWVALTASTVALLLLRGPYETAGQLTSAFDPAQLGRTLTGRPGGALVARLVLLAAAAVSLRWLALRTADRTGLGGRLRWAGALFASALAVTWAAAEHASAGIQVALAVPVAVLHLLAMGGLAGRPDHPAAPAPAPGIRRPGDPGLRDRPLLGAGLQRRRGPGRHRGVPVVAAGRLLGGAVHHFVRQDPPGEDRRRGPGAVCGLVLPPLDRPPRPRGVAGHGHGHGRAHAGGVRPRAGAGHPRRGRAHPPLRDRSPAARPKHPPGTGRAIRPRRHASRPTRTGGACAGW
ncbi:hypothetical protein GCM10020254_15000 [Streptomyces goshikiensis]